MAEEEFGTRDVVTVPETDAENPVMYQHTTYILGAVGAMCVLGIVALALLGKQVDAGLVAIGASAVGGLVTLLAPRK